MNRTEAGFSLVELMIAMLIGAMIVLGALSVHRGNEVSRHLVDMLSEVQGNGRVAMKWLKHDLRLAGSAGAVHDVSRVRASGVPGMVPTATDDCFAAGVAGSGWGLALLPSALGRRAPAVVGLDDVGTDDDTFAGCIDATDYLPGSDVLSVHYADPEPLEPAALANGGIYLQGGIGGGVVFRCTADGQDCRDDLLDAREDPSGTTLHRLVSRLYFVRGWWRDREDGVPTLVRVTLEENGRVVQEPLIGGVAELQLAYGVDSDGDGGADRLVGAKDLPLPGAGSAAAAWHQVVSVRASLLLQSIEANFEGHGPAREVTVGERSVAIERGHVGKVFSTTVALRNPISRAL